MYPGGIKAKHSLRLKQVSQSLLFIVFALGLFAQTPQTNSTNSQQNPNNQQQQVPEAGGPQSEIGPIAVPKKKPEEDKPVEKPPKVKNPAEIGTFSIKVDVPLVNLGVSVVTNNGQFVPNLKADNFRIYEDGVPQKIDTFAQQADKPITAVLLIEFASTNYYFMMDALNAAYAFTGGMKKDDWIAVESFDMKPHLLVDFTQDKNQVLGALGQLRIPGFSETNMFDALYDTIDRLEGVEGQKYIILIGSGYDSFSKLTYDKCLKKIQSAKDITIFPVSTGQAIRIMADSQMSATRRMDYLQADNEMNTFAKMTGGRAYFPRFVAEMPEDFQDIASDIRNQYAISYHPTNTKQDGTWRKIKVEVVDPTTNQALVVMDQKHKKLKYQVLARDGYKAKNEVE
jgi:VWFA-related protein